jgi:hypothetical protein
MYDVIPSRSPLHISFHFLLAARGETLMALQRIRGSRTVIIVALIMVLILFAVIGSFIYASLPHDVTENFFYNGGYRRAAIYIVLEPSILIPQDLTQGSTYSISPATPNELLFAEDATTHLLRPGYASLPAGTQLKLERIIWRNDVFADHGGHATPYAMILNGPETGKIANISDLSTIKEINSAGHTIASPDVRTLREMKPK